ncbi:HAD hydrolase-like protein [Clostridiales bacterium]|nr:HAD hydrolase-like protein [Clostridiales bacterium]
MNWLQKRIINQKKIKIVSFDVFDTLVERKVIIPSDVFAIVGEKILGKQTAETFRKDRIIAEREARKGQISKEVTIQQIYDFLPKEYESFRLELMEEEMAEEINTCYPKNPIQKAYQYCVLLSKEVIITTDMYLPREVIEKILNKCGYKDYSSLYLSNEYNASKRNGDLFDIILKEKKITGKEILHIGDSPKADFISAKKRGINAIFVPKKKWIRGKLYEKSLRNKR